MNRNLWTVAQIGAREHYAVARGLHRHGALNRLYTDLWCDTLRPVAERLPDPLYSLSNRYHPEIPTDRVHDFVGWALASDLRFRLTGSDSDHARFDYHLNQGSAFARRVRDHLLDAPSNPERSVFFGYDTGSLEVLTALRSTEWVTVVDQIDPGRAEKQLVLEETGLWPGWATSAPVLHDAYDDRRRQEWEQADIVVVNSAWSREALQQQGVPGNKIHIVPLAYEPPSHVDPLPAAPNPSRRDPFRILWLGSVILRKGIPYLIQAARQMSNAPVHFDIVGPLGITDAAVRSAPSNMTFHGRVPRDQTSSFYQNADAFILPTLSDGFAITQLEAMAHGLPVIATRNCGRVVEDKHNGLLIPIRDADAIEDAISHLIANPDAYVEMAKQALTAAQAFTLDRAVSRLQDAVARAPVC